MNLEIRPFSSYHKLGYNKSLILTKDGSDLTLVEHEKKSGIKPPSQKQKLYKYEGGNGCNDGVIIRKNLETGAETRIEPHTVKLDYDKAKRYGYSSALHPSEITAKRIVIEDCGTKLDLIAHNGEVREIFGYSSKIGENISEMTPFTRRWIKKYIDFLGKIR